MPDNRSLNISARDVYDIAAAVKSEVTGIGAGGRGNVNAVVDAIIGRAAMGANDGIGGWGRDVKSAINERGQFEGIGKAGGVDRYSKHNPPDKATIEAVKARLGEIAQVGQVPLAPDFGNPEKSKWARGLDTKTAALPAPGGTHVYGVASTTKDALAAAGITGPGLSVSLNFGKGFSAPTPAYDTPSEKMGKRVDVDPRLAGLMGQEPKAPDLPGKLSPDLNDVPQVNEQVAKPDLPGALTLGNLNDVRVSVPSTPDPMGTMPGPTYPDMTSQLYGEVRAPDVPATPDPMTTMAGPTFPDITSELYQGPPASDINVPAPPEVNGLSGLDAYGPNINEQEQGGIHIGTGATPEDAAREAQVSRAMQAVSDPVTSYSYDATAHAIQGNVMGELSPASARNPDAAAQRDYQARQAEYDKAQEKYQRDMAAYEAATKNFAATPVGAKVTDDIPGLTAPGIGASGLSAFGFGKFGQAVPDVTAPAKPAAPTKPTAPTPPTPPVALTAPAPAKPASQLANVSVEDEMGGYSKAATNHGPYASFANATEAMGAIGTGQAPAPAGVSPYDAKTAFSDSVYAGPSYNAVMDAVADQGGFAARKGIGEGFMDDVGISKEMQGHITDGLMGAAKGAITGGLPGAAIGAITAGTGIDKAVDRALGIDKLESKIGAALGLDKIDNLDKNLGSFVSGLFGGNSDSGSSWGGYDTKANVGQGGLADIGSYGIQGMDGTFDSGLSPSSGSVGGEFGRDPSQDGGARYS